MPDKLDRHDIKDLRKRLNLTQEELAAKCKVAIITVKLWESGKLRPGNVAICPVDFSPLTGRFPLAFSGQGFAHWRQPQLNPQGRPPLIAMEWSW